MIYKDRLIQIRERKGLTQKSISDAVSMEESHYRHCEREDELFPIKHLNNICNFLDISLDYIFSFTENKTYLNTINNIDKIKIGNRLKEFRKENKLTQVKLAKNLNTVQSVIAKWESGDNLIATPFLYTICSKYHISADYLLGKTDNPKYLK
ncbi:MAG: helix-turn-helix domain-containing protein [Ruminococcus sp.]|nr:helix-turn-helix domain-containing protein [Ruminococcus sp.]